VKLNRRDLRTLIESVISEESAMDAAKAKAEKSSADKRSAGAREHEENIKKRIAKVRKNLTEDLTKKAQETAEWFKNTVLPDVEAGNLSVVADKPYVIYIDNARIYSIKKGARIDLKSKVPLDSKRLDELGYIQHLKDELEYQHKQVKRAEKGQSNTEGAMEDYISGVANLFGFGDDEVKVAADKIDMEDQDSSIFDEMLSAPGRILDFGLESLGAGDNDIANLYKKFEEMVIKLDLRVEIESAREVFSESKRSYVDQEPLSRGSLYRKRYYGRY